MCRNFVWIFLREVIFILKNQERNGYMNCKYCGHTLYEKDVFCTNCGQPIEGGKVDVAKSSVPTNNSANQGSTGGVQQTQATNQGSTGGVQQTQATNQGSTGGVQQFQATNQSNTNGTQQFQQVNQGSTNGVQQFQATNQGNANRTQQFQPVNYNQHTAYSAQQHIAPVQLMSSFDGGVLEYIGIRILSTCIIIFSFGIATPWAACLVYHYEVDHTVVDGKRLVFNGNGGSLFGNYILWYLLSIITCGIYGFVVPVKLLQWKTEHITFAGTGNNYR